jgi:uncharacterized membrane protein
MPKAPLIPSSAEGLTRRNIDTILRSEEIAKNNRQQSDLVAEAITKFCGSVVFVWVHLIWFAAWSLLNITLPAEWRWDPVPFPFLTLFVSLEAIFLSTFILISENREGAIASRRAHLDLQINLLAEQENTKMLELLERIAAKVGVAPDTDPEVQALLEDTRPEKVLQQIDQRLDEADK